MALAARRGAERRSRPKIKICLTDDRQNITFAEDQEFLAVHLDGRAAVASKHDAIAFVDLRPRSFAVPVDSPAVADRQHATLLRLLAGRVGQHDSAGRSLLG